MISDGMAESGIVMEKHRVAAEERRMQSTEEPGGGIALIGKAKA